MYRTNRNDGSNLAEIVSLLISFTALPQLHLDQAKGQIYSAVHPLFDIHHYAPEDCYVSVLPHELQSSEVRERIIVVGVDRLGIGTAWPMVLDLHNFQVQTALALEFDFYYPCDNVFQASQRRMTK